MVIIEGTIRVRSVDEARPHIKAMVVASRAETGCIDYAFAADLLDPTLIRISESWESRDALEKHRRSDHMKIWRVVWKEIGITDRSLRLYEAEPEVI